MQAPTASELLKDPTIREALEQAWVDSLPADSVVVATFHTHPNPSAEGWYPGPSIDDTRSAWFLGVPCLIRADIAIYTTGPDSRRGGLHGESGYPL